MLSADNAFRFLGSEALPSPTIPLSSSASISQALVSFYTLILRVRVRRFPLQLFFPSSTAVLNEYIHFTFYIDQFPLSYFASHSPQLTRSFSAYFSSLSRLRKKENTRSPTLVSSEHVTEGQRGFWRRVGSSVTVDVAARSIRGQYF